MVELGEVGFECAYIEDLRECTNMGVGFSWWLRSGYLAYTIVRLIIVRLLRSLRRYFRIGISPRALQNIQFKLFEFVRT